MARDDPVDRRLEERGVEPRAGQMEAVDVVIGGVARPSCPSGTACRLQARQRIGVLELAGGIRRGEAAPVLPGEQLERQRDGAGSGLDPRRDLQALVAEGARERLDRGVLEELRGS